MIINNRTYRVKETYDSIITIPDCFVKAKNKIGGGHGEKKLYFGTKETMREFFGPAGFEANCFILKQDLLNYLRSLHSEYLNPSQNYFGKSSFPSLWNERMKMVEACPEVLTFTIKDQTQIDGPRGYVNSDDYAYELIRELSLPLVSYISVMEIADNKGNISFYWKLFVDFDIIAERKNGPLVLTYGKSSEVQTKQNEEPKSKGDAKQYEIRNARVGQGKYREKLLEECPFCPITMVNDERLLIASHIKPWVVSNDREKIDPHNGYILTPLYDKLFDKGFITFTEDKHMLVSDWLSPKNCQRLALVNNTYYPRLPMDEFRMEYLKYHREFVFKG